MTTSRTQPPRPPAPQPLAPTLGDVVARIGAEVSVPLTSALERVVALASTGRIDRLGLQALRSEIDSARRVGLRGQQIARLAGGNVRKVMEPLDLPQCLRNVLAGQSVQTGGATIALPEAPTKAEVLGDASLLHAVLDAAAAWSGALAQGQVRWGIDVKPWPVRARVTCIFVHRPADHAAARRTHSGSLHHEAELDTLDWLLLNFTAHMSDVLVDRQDSPSHTTLTLEFMHTVNDALEETAAADRLASPERRAQSIAGCQLLMLASQRDTRQRLRQALQGQDLQIDHVSTVDDARLYCRNGAPGVLVFESAFQGDALRALMTELIEATPATVLVEVLPAGEDCELPAVSGTPFTRLGIDGLRHTLLPVLLLEIGRNRDA